MVIFHSYVKLPEGIGADSTFLAGRYRRRWAVSILPSTLRRSCGVGVDAKGDFSVHRGNPAPGRVTLGIPMKYCK